MADEEDRGDGRDSDEQGSDDDFADYDLDRIRAEIQQEKQMKEMLDQSTAELKLTVSELEKRFDGVEDEGNEWKTRYETQEEMNNQLDRQILLLRQKLEESKQNSKDGKNAASVRTYDELSDASLKKLMKQMEKEKQSLEGQLRDYEWRLDQESKAFHKANDERKQYLTEIHQARLAIENKQRQARVSLDADVVAVTGKIGMSPRDVPSNQRILDPKKGPIKKTAAVKKLPKLKTTNSPKKSPSPERKSPRSDLSKSPQSKSPGSN